MFGVTKILAVVLLATVSVSGQTATVTCKARNPLVGPKGFNVCLYNQTNLVTDIGSNLANALSAIQNALQIGSCECQMNCSPSQITCHDPQFVKNLIPGYNLDFSNGFIKFLYALEDYRFYCVCPAADGTYTCLPSYTGSPCNQ